MQQEESVLRAIEIAKKTASLDVPTSFCVKVLSVSKDGRFVDVIHRVLEWSSDSQSTTVMRNSYGEDIQVSPTKPWIIKDVPVKRFKRGQWQFKCRPKTGDDGIIVCSYHDLRAVKEKSGFQSTYIFNVHDINNCFYIGTDSISHEYVDADEAITPYPSDEFVEFSSDRIKIIANDPIQPEEGERGNESVSILLTGATITITGGEESPIISVNSPNGEISTISKTAVVNATTSVDVTTGEATVNSDNLTINSPISTFNGDVAINGNLDVSMIIRAVLDVLAAGKSGATHTHTGGTIQGNTGAPI